MRRDLDLDCDPTELVLEPPDRSQLREMFRRFEFRGLLGRVDDLDEAVPAAAPVAVDGHGRAVARGRAAARARPRRARRRRRPLRAGAGGRRRSSALGRERSLSRLRDAELVAHDVKTLPRLPMRRPTTR